MATYEDVKRMLLDMGLEINGKISKREAFKSRELQSGGLKAFFLVSMLLLLLSCEKTYEVRLPLQEFFLSKYVEGIYRFKVIKNKPLYGTECEVELKDLLKGKRYRMRLQEGTGCVLFEESRYLEIAGDKFTPPKGFVIVQNVPIEEGIYLWVYEKLEKVGRRRHLQYLPHPPGGEERTDYDYGHYRTRPPYYDYRTKPSYYDYGRYRTRLPYGGK